MPIMGTVGLRCVGESECVVKRTSPLTGQVNEMTFPIDGRRIQDYMDAGQPGLIQDSFPDLSGEQREFLMTGYTAEDWVAIFPPEDEEDES